MITKHCEEFLMQDHNTYGKNMKTQRPVLLPDGPVVRFRPPIVYICEFTLVFCVDAFAR